MTSMSCIRLLCDSGIGLAVCDEIITRSGGTLTIANAPGGGTLVSVRLPFAPESSN